MILEYTPKSYIKPINVPGSKSITNRLIVLKQLFFQNLEIENASKSTDSISLADQIKNFDSTKDTYHVEDGGTTLRFLICLLAIGNRSCQITCGDSLLRRPHAGLITALNNIGFNIAKNDTGFGIKAVDTRQLKTHWEVDVSTSSQYTSALLLIAPSMDKPITLKLVGTPVSKGYFELTASLMQDLGLDVCFISSDTINIAPFAKHNKSMLVTVESDWSSISYFVLLSKLTNQRIEINNVNLNSLQPDKETLKYGTLIGVNHKFNDQRLILEPDANFITPVQLERDYTNCPDIAPTEIVGCFALDSHLISSGNKHLQYKESNRAVVLAQELQKFSDTLPKFKTHNDHRIAMSLAALCIFKPIQLNDIEVVSKSFPDFWQEVSKLGILLKTNNG